MTASGTEIEYQDGDTTCRGEYFLPPDTARPAPVVLVIHAWDGLVDEVRDKADRLAGAGYIAFAIDVYGDGKTWTDFSKVNEVLGPYLADRAMLRNRLLAALTAAASIPGADPERTGVMGYCFGGLCALDLARAADPRLTSAVSFHGSLLPSGLEEPDNISAAILVLHGEDDPLVPPEQVNALKAELTRKQADWQLVSYGHTVHAFTRPAANLPEIGAVYNESADRRSWQAMLNFFAETLGD